jgi:hypothetical protein
MRVTFDPSDHDLLNPADRPHTRTRPRGGGGRSTASGTHSLPEDRLRRSEQHAAHRRRVPASAALRRRHAVAVETGGEVPQRITRAPDARSASVDHGCCRRVRADLNADCSSAASQLRRRLPHRAVHRFALILKLILRVADLGVDGVGGVAGHVHGHGWRRTCRRPRPQRAWKVRQSASRARRHRPRCRRGVPAGAGVRSRAMSPGPIALVLSLSGVTAIATACGSGATRHYNRQAFRSCIEDAGAQTTAVETSSGNRPSGRRCNWNAGLFYSISGRSQQAPSTVAFVPLGALLNAFH